MFTPHDQIDFRHDQTSIPARLISAMFFVEWPFLTNPIRATFLVSTVVASRLIVPGLVLSILLN
jgi:hypothetical protein